MRKSRKWGLKNEKIQNFRLIITQSWKNVTVNKSPLKKKSPQTGNLEIDSETENKSKITLGSFFSPSYSV